MTNVTIFIMKASKTAYEISNVTLLSIGAKLIYVEYKDGDADCVRAFGRTEFDSVEIDNADATVSGISLANTVRFEARFPEVNEDDLPF